MVLLVLGLKERVLGPGGVVIRVAVSISTVTVVVAVPTGHVDVTVD